MHKTATVLIFGAAIVTGSAVAPAFAQETSSLDGQSIPAQVVPLKPPEPPRRPRTEGRHWSFLAAASNVLESNIDRNQENNHAAGMVVGLGGQYRNRADRPSFTAQYQAGAHVYAGAPSWDRISHNARSTYERRVFKPLSFEAVGEISIKGSTEDRELGNQYIVSPRLQYRLPKDLRIGLETGYRVKHYADRARNATNPYGGARLTRHFGQGRWDLGYRYEENHSDTTRNRYIRSTYSGDCIVPVTPADAIGFELKFRSRRYERLVRVDDRRVPLRDLKWSLSPQWVHVLNPRLQLRASYEFESRGANDPTRNYGAHSTILAVERRW
jgi:hypothetical protein